MNPYLESSHFWADFHATFIPALRAALTAKVAPAYFVGVQEHVYIHEPEDKRLLGVPDVDIAYATTSKKRSSGKGTATVPAPATVTIPQLRKRKVGYLQVVDGKDRSVITVIELLKPSNKYAGADRDKYLTKRLELFATQVNFVELDFLRGGPRLPLTGLPDCSYYAMVSRPATRPKADIWPLTLRETLPSLPIPLREGEPEPLIDLKAVLDRVYDEARYGDQIYDYTPEPQLSPADAEWATAILAAAPKA
jgi:hypothetical protein